MQDGFSRASELAVNAANQNTNSQDAAQGGNDTNAANQQNAGKDGQQDPPAKSPEELEAEKQQQLQQQIDERASQKSQELIQQKLKDYGVESEEELREILAERKKPAETEEEKKKKQAIYTTSLNTFAVENDLMSLEDLQKHQEISSKDDESLVFGDFASDEEIKNEVLEELGEDPSEEEILNKIREKFEQEYPLNSSSERIRKRAENKIKNAATQLRSPLQSSFNKAKQAFDDEQTVKVQLPKYEKAMDKIISASVPETYSFFKGKDGDEEFTIDVPISSEAKKEILDQLKSEFVDKNVRSFISFTKGEQESLQKQISERAELLVLRKVIQEGQTKLADKFTKIGMKQGSDTGAQNSFATNQGAAAASTGKSDPTQEIIDSTRQKNK
jgi:hypothetical protein